MVLRWMASAFLRAEKRFKRIVGHRDLWALEAMLNPTAASKKARSNINLTAAPHFQLAAGHGPSLYQETAAAHRNIRFRANCASRYGGFCLGPIGPYGTVAGWKYGIPQEPQAIFRSCFYRSSYSRHRAEGLRLSLIGRCRDRPPSASWPLHKILFLNDIDCQIIRSYIRNSGPRWLASEPLRARPQKAAQRSLIQTIAMRANVDWCEDYLFHVMRLWYLL